MKDAYDGKQHKTYPKFDSIIGNFFQINVDIAGIINCFRLVVSVYDCTQLQCGVGVDGLKLHMRNYKL